MLSQQLWNYLSAYSLPLPQFKQLLTKQGLHFYIESIYCPVFQVQNRALRVGRNSALAIQVKLFLPYLIMDKYCCEI